MRETGSKRGGEPGRAGLLQQRLGWTCSEECCWRDQGRRAPVLMVQTPLQIPASPRSVLAKRPVPLQLPTARVSCHPLLSPSGRTLWGAVRSIPTHFQCAPCRGGTWENPGCLFNLFLKLNARVVWRSIIMVATIFKVLITYYFFQILSSFRSHLFHPFWFIQMDPYIICHKLFKPPVETQLETFQEFPPALTTVCFTETIFFPHENPMKEGAALPLSRWRTELQTFKIKSMQPASQVS